MTLSKERIKVLYVCPWAHWAGHPPVMLERETRLLQKAGFDVSLCTFRGVLGQESLNMTHKKVVSTLPGFPLKVLLLLERVNRFTKTVAWIIEQFSTICLAVSLKKKLNYDILFLRDGDPFVFMPFLLGCFTKHRSWLISLFGSPQVRTPGSVFFSLIHASFWKPIYRRSFRQNQYICFCENEYIKEFYEKDFAGGILNKKIRLLHRPIENPNCHITKKESRMKLGLPLDKIILLHFGLLHEGKDLGSILTVLPQLPGIILLQAGESALSVNLEQAIASHKAGAQIIIKKYFIPEEEKPYYFKSADVQLLSYKKDFIQTASMLWESASFRLPVVASDVGELGDLVKKYGVGLLFQAEDAGSLKNQLVNFLSLSEKERINLTCNYVKFIEDFSEESWIGECTDIFSKLLNQSGSTSR
jgi:glycosyltransferase involved in cell wall biosynthesis